MTEYGETIIEFSNQVAEKRKQSDRRTFRLVVAGLLAFFYGATALLFLLRPGDQQDIGGFLRGLSLLTLLFAPGAFLGGYLLPRFVHRIFNPFAVYTKGISPPFRDVTSLPCPPWVTGWSLRRFLQALRISWQPGRLFLPYRDILQIARVREWKAGFAFDLIMEHGVRVRMMDHDLEAYYFPEDKASLWQVYNLMELIRAQVNAGAKSVSIDLALLRSWKSQTPGKRDECPQGLPVNSGFIERMGSACEHCGRELSLRPELLEVHVGLRRLHVLCASCHARRHQNPSLDAATS